MRFDASTPRRTRLTSMSEIAYSIRRRTTDDDARVRADDSSHRERCARFVAEQDGPVDATNHSLAEKDMDIRNAATDVMAAVKVMQHAGSACEKLAPLGRPMTREEIEHRARVIAAVISASSKLQQLRDRARTLEDALTRFKARKQGLAA
jgi:hypothetical protein